MVSLKEATSEAIQEKLGNVDTGELIAFLFDRNLIDIKRCQYALIKKHYWKLLRENQDLKSIDAKQITAVEFSVSISQVEKALYYYTKVEI